MKQYRFTKKQNKISSANLPTVLQRNLRVFVYLSDLKLELQIKLGLMKDENGKLIIDLSACEVCSVFSTENVSQLLLVSKVRKMFTSESCSI